MARQILIDPVTRIEGHAKITVYLGDAEQVTSARLHIAEFRGFEKFCEGRPFAEMPALTARVCGICPVSHILASAKAGDGLLAVAIPPAADKLRRLINLGQIVQSHALSFFHLSAPDLLLGWDAPIAERNVFGLMAADPEIARGGIRLRQFGQMIIEALGGKKIHPAWAVPGGVRHGLAIEDRDRLRERIPEVRQTTQLALARFKAFLDANPDEAAQFGHFPSLYLGLVAPDGTWEHYNGKLSLMDDTGKSLIDDMDPLHYASYLGEHVEPDSYLKSPYYRPLGLDQGMYRVGPLARLNICQRVGTPLAEQELTELRQRGGYPTHSSFMYHYARLIEILTAIERIEILLEDPMLQSDHLRSEAGVNRRESVGISEAPRGTLFHHYKVDGDGKLLSVNMIIATGQNNLAMNKIVTQLAQRFLNSNTIAEPLLNRIEAGVRAYDPCLSCSTHAVGQMPLIVELVNPRGEILRTIRRGDHA